MILLLCTAHIYLGNTEDLYNSWSCAWEATISLYELISNCHDKHQIQSRSTPICTHITMTASIHLSITMYKRDNIRHQDQRMLCLLSDWSKQKWRIEKLETEMDIILIKCVCVSIEYFNCLAMSNVKRLNANSSPQFSVLILKSRCEYTFLVIESIRKAWNVCIFVCKYL